MDSQNAISFRNFASSMGDARLLDKVDAFIQDHLLEVSEQEDFLKLPRLKVSFTCWVGVSFCRTALKGEKKIRNSY